MDHFHHNVITLLSPVAEHWSKSCWKEMCLLDRGFQVGHFDYSINLFVYISIYLFILGARESSLFFLCLFLSFLFKFYDQLIFSSSNGSWSTDGCTVLNDSSMLSTVCSCNHLTNFAVLMQYKDIKVWCYKRSFQLS